MTITRTRDETLAILLEHHGLPRNSTHSFPAKRYALQQRYPARPQHMNDDTSFATFDDIEDAQSSALSGIQYGWVPTRIIDLDNGHEMQLKVRIEAGAWSL